MSANENLVDRVRELLNLAAEPIVEKKMFSGLCFMVNDKMCIVVRPGDLMLRINPLDMEAALAEPGVETMVMKGKPMKNYIVVDEAVLHTKKQLAKWVQMALAYNPIATVSKRKSKGNGK